MKNFVLISQLGISIVVPILLCTYAGVWLENKFSFPFTVIFIVLGILAGGRNAYALLKESIKKDTKEDEDEEE